MLKIDFPRSYSHTLILSYILIFSSCSFGPVTANRASIPEPEQFQPEGPRQTHEGLYFKVITNSPKAQTVGRAADQIYQDILSYTKLTESLRPYSLYPLYFYANKKEYLAKTGMPEWSGGVFDRGRLFFYDHPGAGSTLAHEISHLIFWEFFNGPRSDLLWLNEGLAMHAEYRLDPASESRLIGQARVILASHFIPLQELTSVRTALEHKEKEAQVFYLESWLLARFLLLEGGNVGFYELLRHLKSGYPLPQALAYAFPAKWRDLPSLEASFREKW